MRVRIAEGAFALEYGEAFNHIKTWDWYVTLDILPGYPMAFSEREFFPVTASDGANDGN